MLQENFTLFQYVVLLKDGVTGIRHLRLFTFDIYQSLAFFIGLIFRHSHPVECQR